MENILERLRHNDRLVEYALLKLEGDWGSSAVLNAVVKELQDKSHKALRGLKDADELSIRDRIIEVEQAAVSAKVAAEAAKGLSDDTRQAVVDAYMSYCLLKSDL
jgi:hypothetical protein